MPNPEQSFLSSGMEKDLRGIRTLIFYFGYYHLALGAM